ncbi:ABC transporter permease [Pyxidicoccus sp. MSG2]|uniref:ABC transporter permease n=1 Tax=Pyxidicoccus sp. MSG2 TaxID=2996790 RepID=UPI00226F8731|nr:ABC transporter permease [Pyxidicoccus sp. MSG2]MCY1021112.1 ABC transporter permease [Pyxidicoccus sp. MSG2]
MRKVRFEQVALGVVGTAVFLLAWELATHDAPRGGMPGPLGTAQGLFELAGTGALLRNVVASVFRVSYGFTLAVIIGIPLGVWVGWYARAHYALNPFLQLLRPISPIAWLPVATLWFGSGDVSAVFLIFMAAFFPMVVSTSSAVRAIENRYLKAAENFEVRGVRLATRVIFPAILPQVVSGMRLALGIAWVVVVAAEMLGVRSGLGYQVNDARNNLRFELVTAAMVVIGVIGFGLDGIFRALERQQVLQRGARPGDF